MLKKLSACLAMAGALGLPAHATAQELMPVDVSAPYEAPRGATLAVNLNVPLGARNETPEPTYGITLAYGQEAGVRADGHARVFSSEIADLRFNGEGVSHFDLANMRVADFQSDDAYGPKAQFSGESGFLGLVLVFAVVPLALLLVLDSSNDE